MPVERREQVTRIGIVRVNGQPEELDGLDGRRQPSMGGTSRMSREAHVRFCERLGVKFPGPTYTNARCVYRSRSGVAVLFCIVTMLGWGSWANTQKLAGKDRWPFELFYWDYAIGVFAFSLLFAFTLGSCRRLRNAVSRKPSRRGDSAIWTAIFSGVLFNISNILLVVAIDAAGMAVAFPVGVGLALVIGTVKSYVLAPQGNATLLFAGVALIVFAMIMSGWRIAVSARPRNRKPMRGLAFSAVAGCLMGFFYPQLQAAVSPDFSTRAIRAGIAHALHRAGPVCRRPGWKQHRGEYDLHARGQGHLPRLLPRTRPAALAGIPGGCIWMLALSMNVIASGVAGPAISYALGQGATLVAAIWGVFIWREFVHAPKGTWTFVGH
jgi:glucose uptake protein